MSSFTESVVEQAAPAEAGAEPADYAQLVLEALLCDALIRLNPALPAEDDAGHWALQE